MESSILNKITKKQFANSVMWRFTDIIFRKLIGFIISILLARLITPEAYGIIALTTVFITFSDIFILNGFNIALIRKDRICEKDYSTVFCMSLIFSIVLYLFFFFISSYVSNFYNSIELKYVLRVITIIVLFQSVTTVIRAKATRELEFKKMAISSSASSVIAGVVGVILAYDGYGVWALVVQQLLNSCLDMIFMIILFSWKISIDFSRKVACKISKFSFGVLGTAFLDFCGNNMSSLVIGKSYSTVDLGYYNRGNMLPETIGLNVYSAINGALLPTLASHQNDIEGFRHATRKIMSLSVYIVFPLMFGLLGISDVLIPVLLTDKWIPIIPLMNIFCLSYAINPIRSIAYNVFFARGESRICVLVEFLRFSLMFLSLFIVVFVIKDSIYFLLVVNLLINLLVVLVTQYLLQKFIGYTIRNLIIDIFPTLVMSVMIMFLAKSISLSSIADGVSLLFIQIVSSVLLYIILSMISKNDNFIMVYQYFIMHIVRYSNKKAGDSNG